MAVEILGRRDVPVDALTYFPGNARRGDVDKIRESVRRLGQYRSVVVRDTDDALVILAGNHTVRAMVAEHHETVSCEIIRCTDDEAYRVNLSDNRLSDLATDNADDLVQLLSYLDGDYVGTGWTEEDVGAMLTPPEPGPGGEDLQDPGDDDARHLAVVIICDSETDQQATLEDLKTRGYDARTVRLGDTVLNGRR